MGTLKLVVIFSLSDGRGQSLTIRHDFFVIDNFLIIIYRPASSEFSVKSSISRSTISRQSRPKSHVFLASIPPNASNSFSEASARPNSSNSDATISELDLPWCATLPIAPPLRAQWQKLIENGESVKALQIFPNIWNSLRVSTNWILTTTQEQLKNKQNNPKGKDLTYYFYDILCNVLK